jgi:hypothetical protein
MKYSAAWLQNPEYHQKIQEAHGIIISVDIFSFCQYIKGQQGLIYVRYIYLFRLSKISA